MSMRVISWEEYINMGTGETPLAVTIGVFDGVHRGHQSLIQRICTVSSPAPQSPVPSPYSLLPTVVTFKQNPQRILMPDRFAGDIINLEQKLRVLEFFGVQLTVLIDFSEEFSKISGRDFIDLLLGCRPVKLIAMGRNFRCGHDLDTGAEEIQHLAEKRGLEVWAMPPVMDEGQPVSSSRIRQVLAAGRQEEAERLMGWPKELIKLGE